MHKLLMIHTIRALVEDFGARVLRTGLRVEVFHILDEPLLERIRLRGRIAPEDTERLKSHIRAGVEIGVTAALVTCSTLSRCVALLPSIPGIRVLPVDAAWAEAIVRFPGSVAILATNPTTLEPTRQTLMARGSDFSTRSNVEIDLVEKAFAAFQRGDRQGHDHLVASAVREHLTRFERVALAQATMAGAMELLSQEERARVYTSPDLAVQHLADILR